MRRLLCALLPIALAAPALPVPQSPAPAPTAQAAPRPDVLAEVVRVVDGDTIHVRLNGKVEKLRLLCVDTEEKLSVTTTSASKPGTVFGEECALWAQKYFADLEKDGKPAVVGLRFPPGKEKHYDPFGRLLCHVILPDGTDYNLMLVKLGKSPYFTKYGRSELCDAEFAAAQAAARKAELGIWNPKANVPSTEGAPSARRPYERLLPWWDARADAVTAFEQARKREGERVVEAESAADLESAAKREGEVTVFGEVGNVFDEPDGSRTVLLRSSERDRALRVRIPKERVEALAAARLDEAAQEFHQNYVWYRGRIARERAGFTSQCTDPAQFRLAGPEPRMPDAAPARAEGGK